MWAKGAKTCKIYEFGWEQKEIASIIKQNYSLESLSIRFNNKNANYIWTLKKSYTLFGRCLIILTFVMITACCIAQLSSQIQTQLDLVIDRKFT